MKKVLIFIFAFLVVNILSIFLFLYFLPKNNSKKFIPVNIGNNRGVINSYNIFGQHFNVEGEIYLEDFDENNYKLVLNNGYEEIDVKYFYQYNDNVLSFKTNEYSNTGIFLDGLNLGDYYLLFKNKDKDEYYAFDKNTDYEDLTYYTITKDGKNNLINITFSTDGLLISVNEEKLPENVYDIYLDAGHGGIDSGALGYLGDTLYMEKDINFNITLKVRDLLEEMGYKVLLSRETDINLEKYGPDGRTALPYKYKTKYSFSIHNNSDSYSFNDGGFEIYMGNNYETSFINYMANKLIKSGIKASYKTPFKVSDGVYYMPFDDMSIYEAYEEWSNRGYTLYDIKEDTPYMFMIREIGGIVTHAYTDGRNPEEGTNIYMNSNQAAEAYLFELGYMIYPVDLDNLLNNSDTYARAIAEAIDEYLREKSI